MVVDQVHWTLVLYILTLFLPWLPNLPKVSRELDHGWFPNFLVIDQINKEPHSPSFDLVFPTPTLSCGFSL